MPLVPQAERDAIREAIHIGREWGYGNIISHLRTAWARDLMDQYGFTWEQAKEAAHGSTPMPIAMQQDILIHGDWDTTGRRYQEPTDAH